MKRIVLDTAAPTIRRFIGTLPIDSDGIELELDGRIVCRVVPPDCPTEPSKEALVRDRWELIQKVRRRTKRLPAAAIEREIQDAIDEVRARKRG